MIIKPFNKSEIDDYINVIQTSFQTVAKELELTKGIFPASGAFFDKNGFHKLLNKGAVMVGLYAEEDNQSKLVGCIAYSANDGKKYKIMKLAILPSYRHKGYGSRLMDHIENIIDESSGNVLSLGMVSENEVLKKWYVDRGFQIVKVKRYKQTNFNICFMEKKINDSPVCGKDTDVSVTEENSVLQSDVSIWLLTHEREKERWSNTGALIKEGLPESVEIFYWSRVEPPKELLNLLKDDTYYPILVFPVEDEGKLKIDTEVLKQKSINGRRLAFVILDGTWKEARKMLRKSDYLHALPYVTLENLEKTRYTLRRNKDIDHICTVEVAIELYRLCEEHDVVNGLNASFEAFLSKAGTIHRG